jgi:RimJ/RimL family protein N-acetyltransferase
VVVDGRLVSVAHSSRRTLAACELGINTISEARRQGYATAATRAWTRAIQQEGLTPIYSAFTHNTASLRLAAAAGYMQVSASVYGPISETHE